jgi:hypothetical protein
MLSARRFTSRVTLPFSVNLQAEQTAWKRYLAARMEFDDSNQSTLTRFREAAHDAKTRAMAERLNSNYPVACLATRRHALTFLEQTLQTLAETPPAVSPSAVLRLNFFNLPMTGQTHSRLLGEISETIRNEATHHPGTSMSIVFLPNTSEWGKGMEVNRGLASLVAQARQNVIAKIGEAVDGRAVDGEEREARGELDIRVAERELVRQLGDKLYGYAKEARHGRLDT